MDILNLSAYKFVSIEDGPAWHPLVTERYNALGLKGTILLAPEGINLFMQVPLLRAANSWNMSERISCSAAVSRTFS